MAEHGFAEPARLELQVGLRESVARGSGGDLALAVGGVKDSGIAAGRNPPNQRHNKQGELDRMPIPPLDSDGALGIADHVENRALSLVQCSLSELHQRFVVNTMEEAYRQELWDGWMQFREAWEMTGLPYATWLGGSFLTSKAHPSDIDQCVVFDAADLGLLAADARAHIGGLLDTSATHETFGCHVFAIANYPVSHPRFVQASVAFTYWTRVFGIDRADRHRSILCVTEGGVF